MPEQNPKLVVLSQGMDIEKEGISFYGKAAENSKNARARDVFRSLVGDEVEHLRILQAEHDSVSGSGKWLPAGKAVPQVVSGLHLFPASAKSSGASAAAPSDLDALKFAMDIEQKGYDLYVKAANDTKDKDGQALYRFLAKIESRHYKILQDAYGYLTHPSDWYDDEEHPMFEGG
jgi:rubrerythrin